MALYWWEVRARRAEALRHADRALALRPGDRDLVIELAPLYLWAGRFDRVAAVIEQAPRAVRELAINQKVLARAYFELGRYRECLAILSRRRIYNWEGEFGHYDVYANAAAALAEQALEKKVSGTFCAEHPKGRSGKRFLTPFSPARALGFAEVAGRHPPNLGVIWRRMGLPLAAYWRGAALSRLGRAAQARRVWRAALERTDREHQIEARAFGRRAHEFATDELAWAYGMCAVRLGEREPLRRVLDFLARLRRDRLHCGGQCSEFFEGVVCELRGDLSGAKRHFRRHAARASEPRLARLHLAALQAGRRRGEP